MLLVQVQGEVPDQDHSVSCGFKIQFTFDYELNKYCLLINALFFTLQIPTFPSTIDTFPYHFQSLTLAC